MSGPAFARLLPLLGADGCAAGTPVSRTGAPGRTAGRADHASALQQWPIFDLQSRTDSSVGLQLLERGARCQSELRPGSKRNVWSRLICACAEELLSLCPTHRDGCADAHSHSTDEDA